jgi:hypothetical protein
MTAPCLTDRDEGLSYSTFPLSLGYKFDFIYIDGRRRLECALTAAIMCHPQTIVVLHDYRRTRHQSVKGLFDIVEDGPQFRVMRRKHAFADEFDWAYTSSANEAPSEKKGAIVNRRSLI